MKDAERRDFTMNGLSADATGVVYDYVGGIADAAARRVRFIGDPDQRIAEDYLRILRFFRIHAAFGAGEPDRDGYLACIRGRAGLASLSAERVRMEMLKLLVAHGAPDAAVAMADGGLLQALIGGVVYTGPLSAMIAIEGELGLPASSTRRLAALTVAVTEDAKRVATRLRLSNVEAKALDSMGHRWWRFASKDEANARRLLYRLGAERYHDRVLLGWARDGGDVGFVALARARRAAAALDCAEISASRRRLHRAGHGGRTCARACADACRGRLACGGFSTRGSRTRFHCRSSSGTRQPR